MAHAIEVTLSANVEKFNQGMAAAKKTGSDTAGFIAAIFSTVTAYFGKMWDSVKSFFSNVGDKGGSAWSSFSSSASSAFDKIKSMLPGLGSATKDAGDQMEGAEKKSDGLISKIGTGLVVAATAAAAAIAAFTAKGLLIDSAFAKASIAGDIGAGALSKFEDVAKRSGVSVADLGTSVSAFQAAMKEAAAGTGGAVFEQLGVSVKNSNNELLATDPTLIDFAKHIAAMGSEAEKYDAAAKAGFGGKVQLLEDIAHASTLASGTTDDQAAAVVRLQKIWHEVLPGGKSMWDEIGTSLSGKLTPALTTASVAILESKNTIIDAFSQIFAGGSMFDKLGDKIKGWADGMAGYFASVVKSATGAAVSVAAYIAKATGLGGDLKTAPSSGYIPAATPLASGQTTVVTSSSMQKQIDDYKAASLVIKAANDATKEEIATGKSLTEARRAQILLEAGVRDGTVKMTLAQYTNRLEELKGQDALQKAAAAAKDAQSASDAAAKKEAENYATVSAAIAAKISENKLELVSGTAVTESQKLASKIDADQASGKRVLTDAHLAAAKVALVELAASEKAVAVGRAQKEVNDIIRQSTIARDEQTAALAAEYAMYGKTDDARKVAMVAVKAEADMQKQLAAMKAKNTPANEDQIKQLMAERDLRTQVGQATLGESMALGYAQQLAEANKLYAAQSISDAHASAAAVLKIDTDIWQQRIKLAGDGTAAQKVLQTEYNTWLAHATKDSIAGANLEQARQLLDVMSAIDSSAQSAAQGMVDSFGQVGAAIGGLTTALSGYGRTQAAIAAQLAQSTKDAGGDTGKISRANALAAQQSAQAQIHSYGDMAGAAKGFFKENSAGYKVMEGAEKAFRAVEMAMAIDNMIVKSGLLTGYTGLFAASKVAEVAATAATVPPVVAAEGVKQTALATTAMAGAVAVPFPGNIAAFAIVAAMLAAIGLSSMGGGSAPSVSEDRQKANGTGTVFGDSTAKSDSIARSIALSASNSNIELTHTAGMLASLRNIESSIAGLGNILIRTSGVTGSLQPDTLGTAASFTSSTTGVAALGGPIGLVLDKISGGLVGKVTSKIANAIFGGNTTSLDTGITAIKASIGTVIASGITSSQYNDTKTDGGWFSSDKYRTQTTGLGTEADQQLTSVITNMAAAIGQAGKLLGIGGDAFTQRLNSFVVDIGKISLKGLTGDEIQKALETAFSKVGDDMAQFAVGGLQQFQQVGEGYLETLTRIATDYANVDSILASVGKTFGAVGLGSIAARENLITLAGGIDALASQTSGFASNFLSTAEQLAPVQKYVTDQLAAMGLSGIQTRDDFKNVVLGLDLTSPAAQQTYASLMALQDAFAKTHAATVDLTKSETEIADERADLQKQIDQLTLTTAQQRAKERLGISAVNLAMFDMITNLQTIADTSDTLKTTISNLKAFRDGILSFKDSLTLGSLSTLTPMQKAIEAQRQYQDLLAKAQGGDTTAQAGIQAAATAYLTANQVINASSGAYVAASAQVQSDLAGLAAIAGTQLTDAQQQLAAYDKQLAELATLNTTASSIEAALTSSNWSAVGTTDMAPLVEEVKGLRADNAELLADNADLKAGNAALLAAVQEQTAAVVQATLTAAANNAAAVTAGAAATAASQSWKAQMMAEANA